jgi:hypothetical protein
VQQQAGKKGPGRGDDHSPYHPARTTDGEPAIDQEAAGGTYGGVKGHGRKATCAADHNGQPEDPVAFIRDPLEEASQRLRPPAFVESVTRDGGDLCWWAVGHEANPGVVGSRSANLQELSRTHCMCNDFWNTRLRERHPSRLALQNAAARAARPCAPDSSLRPCFQDARLAF